MYSTYVCVVGARACAHLLRECAYGAGVPPIQYPPFIVAPGLPATVAWLSVASLPASSNSSPRIPSGGYRP